MSISSRAISDAADAIVDLIKSQPRTPTKVEIAAVIGERLAAPSAARETYLASEWRRALDAHLGASGRAVTDEERDALDARLGDVVDRICAAPVRTFDDLVVRAAILVHWRGRNFSHSDPGTPDETALVRQMKRAPFAIVALTLASTLAAVPARSQTTALDAEKCRAGAQAIAKSIGGTLDERATAAFSIEYPYKTTIDGITYMCGEPPTLMISTYQPAVGDVLKVMVQAGAAFGRMKPDAVRKMLTACIGGVDREKHKPGQSSNSKGMSLTCSAYGLKGENGVTVTFDH
jgi:hypothetical protein